MKHTKSPSGKTHRLQNEKGHETIIRYSVKPQFDDQVQGDLIRKYRAETGDPRPIGRLGTFVDAALLDNGQQQPSLDYLRGFLSGLEAAESHARAEHAALIRQTREQISALEAQQNGISRSAMAARGTQPRVSRLDEGVRAVRDLEDRGW